MFKWFGSKTPPREQYSEADELRKIAADFIEETKFINEKWDIVVRQVYCVFVAKAWREFLLDYEKVRLNQGVRKFDELAKEWRYALAGKLADAMSFWKKELDSLKQKGQSAELIDAMCLRFAYRHVGAYALALAAKDVTLAISFARELDTYLQQGWGIANSMPLPGDEILRSEAGGLLVTFDSFANKNTI